MTDRERQMIEAYLPSAPDPELQTGFEFYLLDARDRPTKVRVVSISFDREGDLYQVVTDAGRLVHGDYEADSETFGGGWYRMAALYDNREDCRYRTHSMYDGWEWLRDIQRKEGLI